MSISTIALDLAYGTPIYLNWRNRRRLGEYATAATAPWSLGRRPAGTRVFIRWVTDLAGAGSVHCHTRRECRSGMGERTSGR